MSTSKITRADCRDCGRTTRHEVLFQHIEETNPEEYHEKDTWQVIRCLGCTAVGFRHRNDDFEHAWEDFDGETQHKIEISLFPRVIKNHKKLTHTHHIPALVRKIYTQTLSAYSEKAYVLASVGLRAIIEAVCNELGLSGNSLEKRIDQLFKGGHVSNGDKKRLHAIRFLGNDAAHEITEPKESELRVALEIVEHLLNSVFILEKKAKSLETVIESYEEFLPILEACVLVSKEEQAISLSALLGRQRRLVLQHIDSFESKIKQDIEEGAIKYLHLSQPQKIGGKEVQFYLVGDKSGISPSEDDSPF